MQNCQLLFIRELDSHACVYATDTGFVKFLLGCEST